MILNLKLKNYRSYKEETNYTLEASASKAKDFNYTTINDFKVLKTSLMYGSNASGKSNIVRALYELRNLIIKKPSLDDDITIYDPFKFNIETLNSPVELTLEFLLDKIKHIYSIEFLDNIVVNEVLSYYPNGRETNVFTRNKFDSSKDVQSGLLGYDFGKKTINVFKNQLLLSKFGDDEPHEVISKIFLYFKRMFVYNATNKLHYEILNDKISEDLLKDENLKVKLEKLINYADTKITGININKSKLNAKNKINYLWKRSDFNISGIHDLYNGDKLIDTTNLSLLEESIGTQSLFVLGAKIIEALETGSVLVVDELDTSLHSFITKMIVMLFQDDEINSNNAQLIFTTHDISLLDKDMIRKDQVWITEKNDKGETDLYSLQDFENLREDTSFDRWYLAGKFGGVPQIKSLKEYFSK
ncbi:AAA family ATPase [Chryseobacterium sp. B21-037]|uniref:AAA family ATPase n=1 Tax=Chryseobacterium sp. B21-037 TaxID=2926038 RepID=UPI0023589F65|nr:ATP-binding protein [Chryseobacterium sp. B21-037]MDC8106707.1 AAA family ATPase [Chryseobacterium sp. B21-037]